MQLTPLKFCGRSDELNTLIERWRAVANLDAPTPQIVVIKGERGVGKTRLALEFYRWLSEETGFSEPHRYWPNTSTLFEKNLEPNPEPSTCRFDLPIPYLWWGLRAGDRGALNGVAGDAIAAYDRFLAPHLVTLLVRANMKRDVLEIVDAWHAVGVDLLLSALHVDAVVSVGKATFETIQILTGSGERTARSEVFGQSTSRADAALRDLEKVLNPKAWTYARTPALIFLDDAQFVSDDAALPGFVERFLYKAVVERWPVMFVTTHWRSEFFTDLTAKKNSFSSILHHGRKSPPSELGPVAGLPGGYIGPENYAEIDLDPVDDLSEALNGKLPGLSADQARALLDTAGGNPRFIEQLIEFLREHEYLFENGDSSNPLTPEGLEETLKLATMQDIFLVVLRRLRKAPEAVQQAVCVASLQGVRFSNDLVQIISIDRLGHALQDALSSAEQPYCMVVGTGDHPEGKIGQFAERLFHQVAEQQRKSLVSLGGESALQNSLKFSIVKLVSDPARLRTFSTDTRLMVLGIAANLFERSKQYRLRQVAQTALGELAYLEISRASLEAAAAAWERLLRIEQGIGSMEEWFRSMHDTIRTWEGLSGIYRLLRWPSKRAHALRRAIGTALIFIADDEIKDTRGMLLLFSADESEVRRSFQSWIERNTARRPDDYRTGMLEIIRGLLKLSELAKTWPNLVFGDGDDPVGDAPFIIRMFSGEHEDQNPEYKSIFLKERAYILGTIFEGDVVRREHFRILDEIAISEIRDGSSEIAEDALKRGLKLADLLGDDLLKLQANNNTGMAHMKAGRLTEAEEYFGVASAKVDEAYSRGTFSIAFLPETDEVGSEAKPIPNVTMEIPSAWTDAFDTDPKRTVHRAMELQGIAAMLYKSLASLAERRGMMTEPELGYRRALAEHLEKGDLENMALDLRNLASLLYVQGKVGPTYSCWTQCLEAYERLSAADASASKAKVWKTEIAELRAAMHRTVGDNEAIEP